MNPVLDLSPASLLNMAERVRASREAEHFVYRETEMDELWRLADMQARLSPRAAAGRAQQIQRLIHQAHDILANEEDLTAAAARLTDAAALLQSLR